MSKKDSNLAWHKNQCVATSGSRNAEFTTTSIRRNAMNSSQETFSKYVDETGQEFYCPINAVKDDRIVSEWELANCVETSTTGRYAGNLKIADRKKPDWRF
jgi:hypothetical protein